MNDFSVEELNALVYELPDEVQKYKLCGDFDAAEGAIGRWLERPVAEALKRRLRLERRILQGLTDDFPYNEKQVIAGLRELVPDFDREDLLRLDREGLAEWITIGGEKRYIHNIVRNVTQKDAEIMRRGGLSDPDFAEKKLLAEEIARIRENGGSCWRFRLRTSICLKEEFFYPGIRVRVHLPIPAERHQISEVKLMDFSGGQVHVDRADSLYRSVCFEDTLEQNREFFVEYEYTVKAVYHDCSGSLSDGTDDRTGAYRDAGKDGRQCAQRNEGQNCNFCSFSQNFSQIDASEEDLQPYLTEQYPHIRFTPYLCALAEEIVCKAGCQTALETAAAIYDYITKNVTYSYMRGYFLIEDIPQYCARNLRGDCGVQALLFLTLCRICGIPAKWQSGLYFGGGDTVGPHDWAMFYVKPFGWLYADPSLGGAAYAEKAEERRRFYFGNIDPFRMAANNAFQQPFACPKRFLPADPYDNQSGEIESDERGFGSRETVSKKKLIWAIRE